MTIYVVVRNTALGVVETEVAADSFTLQGNDNVIFTTAKLPEGERKYPTHKQVALFTKVSAVTIKEEETN